MSVGTFSIIGEKIHCTRIFKTDGKFVSRTADGVPHIIYTADGAEKALPIPQVFLDGADWKNGKVKHCAVAIWQGVYGQGAAQAAGRAYLQALARQQEKNGANYLDVNVDEFSPDVSEKMKLMAWLAQTVQEVCAVPLSIDSSSADILRVGLQACRRDLGRPMLNSVSLERLSALPLAAEFDAVVIASAAGEKEMPHSTAERLTNLEKLVAQLQALGVDAPRIFIDPLVFPIATDGLNGKTFLDSVAAIRQQFGPQIHITAGFSNVSFGLPKRDLINEVFTWLAVQAGADSGIVDPSQINARKLAAVNPETEAFKLAKGLLTGEDEYGMDYITACREGTI